MIGQKDSADILQGAVPVSRLVALLQEVVEDNFVEVLVEGELSNLARPASGHLYLTLKDAEAQLRAVMFRSQARRLRFRPEDGMQVICRGRVSVYRPRGELQLIIDSIEPAGVGGLQLAFEQLKHRLQSEGLFAADRKQRPPAFPRRIGVVTSATGAAIRDILNVLERRAAGVDIILRAVRVQGEGAEHEIAAAIADLNQLGDVDVMIVGRGGGSLEDLWAFNEEVVARAIAASVCPVISAVGHETDWTICDYVADLRAPTPSAAAELVVRNRQELETHLDQLLLRLAGQLQSRLRLLKQQVASLQHRLLPPQERLRLQHSHVEQLRLRLAAAVEQRLLCQRQQLGLAAARLETLSPLRTLGRGYSLVFRRQDGKLLRSADQAKPGEMLDIRLARGRLFARVESSEP